MKYGLREIPTRSSMSITSSVEQSVIKFLLGQFTSHLDPSVEDKAQKLMSDLETLYSKAQPAIAAAKAAEPVVEAVVEAVKAAVPAAKQTVVDAKPVVEAGAKMVEQMTPAPAVAV